ncbi:DUF4231 domain-containing protein [Bradyrhizobium sp.]|jgi:hypothetical protein|uniref:DUF4231 domain-containing protein n=1 Tax=Bradyrhizobium sp. TaxID=376 RepID=UPI003C1648B5
MEPLASAAKLQADWSVTATQLKKTLDLARRGTFVMSGVAALLAAIASQIPESQDRARLAVAVASAVLLGLVSFLTVQLLGSAKTMTWTRIRVASEGLKREVYQYAAMAAPYDDPATSDNLLLAEKDKIANDIDDVIGVIERSGKPGSLPQKRFATPQEYIAVRVKGQIGWLEDRAEQNRRASVILHRWEFWLALVAAVLTAAVGVAGKNLFGLPFDFAALTAVLTTIGGSILAHIEASRYDYLTVTYRATARRLQSELDHATAFTMPSQPWSDFVHRCEAILSAESAAWAAKWSKA